MSGYSDVMMLVSVRDAGDPAMEVVRQFVLLRSIGETTDVVADHRL
jgi:hypothetical protein